MNAPKTINNMMSWLVATGAVFCLIFVAILLYWSSIRDLPFELISYKSTPAKPGDIAFVTGIVKRDIDRNCGVVFSRSLIDAKGVRYALGDGAQIMNSSALRHLNAVSPDRVTFPVEIPKSAAPGIAHINTSLDYICNPIHQFFPISMSINTDIEILQP